MSPISESINLLNIVTSHVGDISPVMWMTSHQSWEDISPVMWEDISPLMWEDIQEVIYVVFNFYAVH